MNQKEFLALLRKQLEENGIAKAYIEKYVNQFKRYFDNISEDDVDEQISSLGDMNDIVENLVNLIEAKKHSTSPHDTSAEVDGKTDEKVNKAQPENETEANNAKPKEDKAESDIPAKTEQNATEPYIDLYAQSENDSQNFVVSETPVIKDNENGKKEISENPGKVPIDDSEHESDTVISNESALAAAAEASPDDESSSEREETVENELADDNEGVISEAFPADGQIISKSSDKNAKDYYDDYIFEGARFPDYQEKPRRDLKRFFNPNRRHSYGEYDYYDDTDEFEEYEAYQKRMEDERFFGVWEPLNSDTAKKYFWGIGLGTLPVSVFLFLVMSGIFLFGFGILSLAIVALLAVLAVITAFGAAVTISGIIFGIVKCFSLFPIGLYEIGIAVKYCGIALALGILVYNAAVRLMPIAIRYLINLYFIVLRYIKKGVYIFRQRCAKLQ